MVDFLFIFKHLVMYFNCQIVFLDCITNSRRFQKLVLESFLISTVCTAITCLSDEIMPVTVTGNLLMIFTGIYHHRVHKTRVLASIVFQIDLYTLSMFSNMILGFISYAVFYILTPFHNNILTAVFNQILYIIEMIFICVFLERHKIRGFDSLLFTIFSIICFIMMLCNLMIVMPYSFTADHAETAFIIVAIISFIGLVIWLKEYRRDNNEKQKLLVEIRELRRQVHHYKEFIPAMKKKFGTGLEELRRKTADSKDFEGYRPLVEEINRLYEEQMEESRKEFLTASSLPKTGSTFIDAILEEFNERAHEEDVSFQVQVFDPPQYLFGNHLVPQIKLEELIGDLLTNALRAICRKPIRFEESIEVDMGISDNGFYEIDIYDTGEPFPEFVLENFGRRGLTTGGTGEGLANMLKILKEHSILLIIKEYEIKSEEFTKYLTLRFSREYGVILETKRDVKLHLYSDQESESFPLSH